MLCFYGQNLKRYQPALLKLTNKDMIVKEEFKGGYSLTRSGFQAMRECPKKVGKK